MNLNAIVKLILVPVALSVFAVASVAQQQSPPPNAELRDQLTKRVLAYHSSLSSHDYQGVWDFLGPGLKKDNPKDIYVYRLKGKIQKWELISSPDVALSGRTKKTDRPVGDAYSRVSVVTTDGAVLPITQKTTWIWLQPGGGPPTWYLAQEVVQEDTK